MSTSARGRLGKGRQEDQGGGIRWQVEDELQVEELHSNKQQNEDKTGCTNQVQ